MGYTSAALAFYLSLAGAYMVGAQVVKSLDTGVFAFLEDFQDNDEYLNIMADKEEGEEFSEFLTM